MQKREVLKYICGILLASISLVIGLNNILQMLNIAQYSKAYQEAAETIYAMSFWNQIWSTGLLIPILEELLFRGMAFRLLRRWIPFGWAMLITAVLFGVYHGNLVQFIYATICGLFLAYLCEKFGTVLASIAAHMAMNLVACIMTEFATFYWMFETGWRVSIITAICVVIFAVSFVWIQKMDVTKMLKKHCNQ